MTLLEKLEAPVWDQLTPEVARTGREPEAGCGVAAWTWELEALGGAPTEEAKTAELEGVRPWPSSMARLALLEATRRATVAKAGLSVRSATTART